MVPNIFKTETVIKNWSGKWSLLFASFYGDIYRVGLDKFVGRSFSEVILSFEKGISSNYIIKNTLQDYSEYLSQLVIKDKKRADDWCTQTLAATDSILALLKKLGQKPRLGPEDYFDLQSAMYHQTPLNFALKRVIDRLPQELIDEFIEKFSEVRTHADPVYNETDRILKKFLEQISQESFYSLELLCTLTKEEIESYFDTKVLPKKEILESRFHGCFLIYENETIKYVVGKDFQQALNLIIKKMSGDVIQGQSAFKGKIVGSVKVIFDPTQSKNFNEGDILVTGMTRPEFLSLMKKSSAFVTDAGGLLSHAAIVARELKKPCIVGTNIATKVLKDGDLVEVDAECGTVIILKRR